MKIFFCFLAAILFTLTQWLYATFGVVSFEQLIFHLYVPISGTDPKIIWKSCLYIPLGIFLLSFIFIKAMQIKWIKKYAFLYAAGLNIAACLFFCFRLSVFSYVWYTFSEPSSFYETYYTVPQKQHNTVTKKPKNLILIYAESIENTYTMTDFFPENLLPKLSERAAKQVSFKGFFHVEGTQWTTAGMVSTLCGIPMKKLSKRKDRNKTAQIQQASLLPSAYCVPDFLHDHGYQTFYLTGSDITFGAIGAFIDSHSFDDYFDLIKYGKENITKETKGLWGFNDRTLFRLARKELSRLAQSDKPFFLMMNTIDSHHPDGFVDQTCPTKYGDFKDVVLCTDQQIDSFMTWIEQQPFYKETVIIVLGDHVAMKNTLYKTLLKNNQREVFNLFINSSLSKPSDRPFTSFDLAPTILEAVGFPLASNQFGLGISLFSDKKTLLQKFSYQEIDAELKKPSIFYTSLFQEKD